MTTLDEGFVRRALGFRDGPIAVETASNRLAVAAGFAPASAFPLPGAPTLPPLPPAGHAALPFGCKLIEGTNGKWAVYSSDDRFWLRNSGEWTQRPAPRLYGNFDAADEALAVFRRAGSPPSATDERQPYPVRYEATIAAIRKAGDAFAFAEDDWRSGCTISGYKAVAGISAIAVYSPCGEYHLNSGVMGPARWISMELGGSGAVFADKARALTALSLCEAPPQVEASTAGRHAEGDEPRDVGELIEEARERRRERGTDDRIERNIARHYGDE